MNKRPGKSILQSFSAFSQPDPTPSSGDVKEAAALLSSQPVARVGAGVIGATQRSLSELREERDQLKALVDAGGASELDPKLIDPSPFPDRLPDDCHAAFDALKQLISEEGQKVPIQVRRHPTKEERYQVVYGHRRWRAAFELGFKVKATILALSDSELVVAQGIENAARQDLSWIERALFAWRMDEAGIKTRDIRAALSVDDPELARLRAVCRALPVDVIELIGRAPKVGRPRWVALSDAVTEDGRALDRIRETLSAYKASEVSSDDRFKLALATVKRPAERKRNEIDLKNPGGELVGKATFTGGDVRLSVRPEHAPAFSAFVVEELPRLMEKFFAQEGTE